MTNRNDTGPSAGKAVMLAMIILGIVIVVLLVGFIVVNYWLNGAFTNFHD